MPDEWEKCKDGRRYERRLGDWLFAVEFNEHARDWLAQAIDPDGMHWPILHIPWQGLEATLADVDQTIADAVTLGRVVV